MSMFSIWSVHAAVVVVVFMLSGFNESGVGWVVGYIVGAGS